MMQSCPIVPGFDANGAASTAHLDFAMFTGDARRHEQCKKAGAEAAEKQKPWRKKYFPFLSQFQAPNGCLARIHRSARRAAAAAAVCLSASGGDLEGDLPYMQLDQVTHTLKREAFGPVYLVT